MKQSSNPPSKDAPDGARRSVHKQASKNYFHLESDMKRQSMMDADNRFSQRLSMMNVMPAKQAEFLDEPSIDYCCDVLQAKFGFQQGSVDNQREHVLLLLANCAARANSGSDDANHHVRLLHDKLFSNYKEWCAFLGVKPLKYQQVPANTPLTSVLHMELMLYLLIWGESANLRHMPECLCYIYHQLLANMIADPHHGDTRPANWFLNAVLRPVWKEASVMQKKNALGKHLEHTKVRNYDDLNEFFWRPGCLKIPVDQIGAALHSTAGKTFYEHRSIFSLVLNYYRIFHFNFMFLIGIAILNFAVRISPNGGKSGFDQFSKIGTVVEPYLMRDLNKACAVLIGSHAFLNFFKCVLEVGHGFQLLTDPKTNSATSSRSMTYGMALTMRLVWNLLFTAAFALMFTSAPPKTGGTDIISYLATGTAVYIVPGLIILALQTFFPGTGRSWFSKFIREGDSCYTGRNMAPPFSFQIQYYLFWFVLLVSKFFVSYWVLVGPLVLPSLAIWEMKLTYGEGSIGSYHNLGVIVSLWAPVVFISNYDTQIYFTIFQAILGAVMGWMMKVGEVRGVEALSKAFRVAPQLFDTKVVTELARLADAQEVEEGRGSQSAVYQSQMMLRFVVVWNEIVNSFREGDLVDDKEAAILQYDIQNTGEVFEPVFLSAGKLNEAMAYAVKLGKSGRGDSELRIQLVQNDCLGAVKSFFNASMYVLEALLAPDDTETLDGFRLMEQAALDGQFLQLFDASALLQVRTMAIEFLEAVLDLPDPDSVSPVLPKTMVHPMGIIRNFVSKMDNLLNALRLFCRQPAMAAKFQNVNFVSNANSYAYAAKGLVNLFHSDTAMGAATRAYLLMSLDRQDAMPKCGEAQRRLGFFMQSLLMEIPQLNAIRSMRSFSVVTPFYSEGVIFSLDELNNPLENHPIFNKASELDKKITILKYLITIHPEEWENFLERIDVSSVDAAVNEYPMELRLWASYRGQTLARTVQGMMLYEDAIKILHWLEIGSSPNRTPEQKQQQLEDMIRLKFSYVCACQVYGKHRAENKQQANDIDFLLQTYPNLRVAYVDTIPGGNNGANRYDTVLIKAEGDEIAEVYRWELPGDPILGEGKPENQNNALPFTRGEYIQTIDMNQQHYFEECLKMPQLLVTADLHPSKQPVTIIGMREHIFTGNASSLAKFKTWQELVFVTLSQRVLANPLYVRMHYGHPDIFDKVMVLTRGGVSKASKGINLSEDVFAGFNTTLRGGVVTHVEFMQCGKGRDVAMSQISMFEGKLANGAGETCLAREAYRMGAFMDFFRLNSMYYSHTGFYFATWLTIVTTYVYIYSKVYLALSGVQEQVIEQMNSTQIISLNAAQRGDFDTRVYHDLISIVNTQYIIQAGMFLTLPLIVVYFAELGLFGGLLKFLNMILTAGPAFFVFQVGTTMHYFDNNIMHGNAKYQATGRGFKITRETFVLLYKAYSASHYRKAWELVGLSLLYLAYGNFALGNYDLATPDNMFASNYKGTSQGFGIQTFALWVVSSMWLLSPFIFNADGLDYEKTKSDIGAWCKWMFMEADETDPDKVHTGGWISWWKGDQEEFYATNGIARFTVILRESRHFFIMWYVVTLKLEAKYVLFVLAAAGATLVLFYVFHIIGLGMKKANYIGRAALYFFLVICFVVGGFVAMNFVLFKKDDSSVAWNKSLCLFFGYCAVVYGINEMLRVANFKGMAVHNLAVVTQLAFFFDFIFGALLLIPLLILSCIPFMNAIQTRMMFNEGFSKAVSASSQHAFSLAAAMGILVGLAAGWQYYMLLSIDVSSAYSTYLQMYKLGSFIKPGNGLTTYITLGGSVAGSIVTSFLGYTLGHRMTVLISGMMSVFGCLVLSLIPTLAKSGSASSAPFMVGILLLSAALGMMLPAVACYIYEISTYDMRSKTMLPFAFAFVVGTAISSYQSGGAVGWVWQSFWCALLMALVTPLMNMFPDSPQWVLERKGYEECETALSILRQRPDNASELRELREDQAHAKKDQDGGSSMYKFGLAVICMIISSLSVASLNIFVANTFKSFADDNFVFLNSLTIEAAGVLVSFFVMDKWPHRNLLAFTLLGVGLCAGALGANDCFTLLKQDYSQRKLILTLFMYVMFFIKGLGLTSTIWVNVTGLFAAKSRYVAIPLLFSLWFAVPAASVALRVSSYTKNAYPWLFALAGLCLVALFMIVMASNRVNGLICTRADMKKDKARRDRLRGSRHSRTPGSFSRQRRQSRSGRQSRSNSMAKSFQGSYHLVASPSANQHVV